MRKKYFWILCFIVERILDVLIFPIAYIACFAILFLLMWGTDSVFESFANVLETFLETTLGIDSMLFYFGLPLLIAVILWCFVYRHIRVRKRAMMASEFYRRPLIACKGTITEVHLEEAGFFGIFEFLRPQWILFDAEDGRQIKAYRPMERRGLLRVEFPTYSGSKGWLYFRKGKKFDNFDHFVNENPLLENPFPEGYSYKLS